MFVYDRDEQSWTTEKPTVSFGPFAFADDFTF